MCISNIQTEYLSNQTNLVSIENNPTSDDTTVRVIHTNYNSIPRITNIVASKVKQSKQNQDFELFHNYSPCRTHHPRALVQLSNMKALLPDFGVL